jgi:signal transduction histidine kinase
MSGSAAMALVRGDADLVAIGPLVRRRVSASARQRWAGAAIVPMVAVTVGLALTSGHLERPLAAALYWGWMTAGSMAIGLCWWLRRPASRFGPLLVGFGVLAWVVSWQASDWPPAFVIGVLAEGPAFLLRYYLFLAFPMGRLEPPAARWLMGALWVVLLGFFLPWALFSPVIAGAGRLTGCASACPQNVLQVASAPSVVEIAGKAETYGLLAITVVVLAVYLARLRAASKPQRRSLAAVAVTSLLLLPAWFVSAFAAAFLKLGPATLDALAWGVVATRALLPVGFLIALLQAERFAARALRDLLERLAARPTPQQWRDVIAAALDDASLRLGYYDPAARRFREPDGRELVPPPPSAGLAWVPVDRDGRPVAAMVIDETLAEDPELVRAAASATLLAVENGHLEGELRASRTRILEAGNAERRRIERDLHDGAQQRLVALRIRLGITSEQSEDPGQRAMLERFGDEVEETIDDLRNLAHGVYPQVLVQAGIGAALAAVARHSATPVRIRDAGVARHSEAIEMTVYFCCLEGLQNAAKHAGAGAAVTIALSEAEGRVCFVVDDDGAGFDPGAVQRGAGLTNLADRVAAVGGTLRIEAAPGHGTHVAGRIPIPAYAGEDRSPR